MIIDDIDKGNTNANEKELAELIQTLRHYTRKDNYATKYEACKFLGVSRATFDNIVASGKLPRGKKVYPGDTCLFWNKMDLIAYAGCEKLLTQSAANE